MVSFFNSLNKCYAFGMTMPGRNANPTTYRHGFNGMEKDDELKGNGNSYDFGARMYDSRIGRWMSVDPRFYLQSGWSTYKAFYNNPILYVDPEGETEFITIITINVETGETKIEQGTANKIKTDGVHPGPSWTKGNPFHSQRKYYDFETVTVNYVDGNGKVLSTNSQSKILYKNGVKDEDNIILPGQGGKGHVKTEDWGERLSLEGEGGISERGGFMLTTEGEEISPTKFYTTGEVQSIDVDLLIAVLGGINGGRGETENALYFSDAATQIKEAIAGVQQMASNKNKLNVGGGADRLLGDSIDFPTITIHIDGSSDTTFMRAKDLSENEVQKARPIRKSESNPSSNPLATWKK